MEPNFSGYVSKANLKCADGRTIMPGAFAHQDGIKVPVVYQHNHADISQVLGHALLSAKDDGTWGDVFLNESPAAKNADILVKHGDIDKFSIWAKNLDESGFNVRGGDIQEVSLVLAGSNPGASISNVLMHSDLDAEDNIMIVGYEIEGLEHSDTTETKTEEPAKTDAPAESDKTVADVLSTLNEEQQTAVNSVIDEIVTEAVTEALTEEPEVQHDNLDSSQKGNNMARNVFDRSKNEGSGTDTELKHTDVAAILDTAKANQGVPSLRDLVRSQHGKELMHADTYGVDNLEILFPDAKALMNTPVFVDRRQEWVKTFLAGTGHSPFSRVKTMYADITADEARARGYIKGNQKVEEVFPIFKRSTGPAWIYKKQKLDRQDIIDITSFDVVAWMKVEMRGKLDEEIARAALFGDGRPTMVGGDVNPDKIPDPGAGSTSGDGIRAIVNDNELYVDSYDVELDINSKGVAWNALLDGVTEAGEDYRGSGNKTAFVSFRSATRLLTIRDEFGHRVYRNLSEVAGDMDVSRIERVPTELFPTDMLAIVLDLADYNFGTDAGGQVTLFDDFDIDFNQYKYLMETYLSGALTLPHSAQVFNAIAPTATPVTATAPTFVDGADGTGLITIPTVTGVVYKINGEVVTGSVDTTTGSVEVVASPAAGYVLNAGTNTWTFTTTA